MDKTEETRVKYRILEDVRELCADYKINYKDEHNDRAIQNLADVIFHMANERVKH